MIYVIDDFVDLTEMNNIKDDFTRVDTPGKSFWVKLPSEMFLEHVCKKVSDVENSTIIPILSFFRQAKEGQDNDWRIHCDYIIEGQKPDRALVVYMSDDNKESLNGTAFWEHAVYGDCVEDISNEDYDSLLENDSNNLDRWTLKSVIGHKKGRVLSYPCNYFHSKYPNEFKEDRIVFVMFYKTIKK